MVLVGMSGGCLGWWLFWAGSLRSEVGCSESERVKMISLRSDNNERSLESEDCGGLAGGWIHESDETRRDRGPLSPCQEGSRSHELERFRRASLVSQERHPDADDHWVVPA